MALILLICITIAFNAENADGRKLLKGNSAQDKLLAQLSIVKEEHLGLKVNIELAQSLSELKQIIDPLKKNTMLLKNKLPSGPSPGTGNAFINNSVMKSGWRAENILKNKLPSGPSPGTGNAYINDGGIKSSWRSKSILKNKLPSGSSPGVGH
ncbi:hypothetical protein SUGI_0943440 [Cryptomeria japonica]|nr:hypothetical protein SUGI_0943440 [Cryptomeria japonica]